MENSSAFQQFSGGKKSNKKHTVENNEETSKNDLNGYGPVAAAKDPVTQQSTYHNWK